MKRVRAEEMTIEVIRYEHEWCREIAERLPFWVELGCRRCIDRLQLLDLLAEKRLYDVYVPLLEQNFAVVGGYVIRCYPEESICCLYPWPKRLIRVFWVRGEVRG